MTVANNHFPCDCRLNAWLSSALFADQRRDHVTANNFCISPYEVHGKSVASATRDSSLLDSCPPDEPDESGEVDDASSEPTGPSTLASGSPGLLARWLPVALLVSIKSSL